MQMHGVGVRRVEGVFILVTDDIVCGRYMSKHSKAPSVDELLEK